MKWTARFFIVLAAGVAGAGPVQAESGRIRLLFSIDQGFGNGIVANADVEALSNMVEALEPLRGAYDVCVLLNPMVKKKVRLKRILDVLVERKMPFVFDVYSSDTFTLGANGPANAPFDSGHGLSISMEQLADFKKTYGPWLAGLRFMEIFGQDYGIRAMKTTNPELKRPGDRLPDDDFFRPDLAEAFLRFAKEHDMFVQWADFGWMPFSPWDKEMPRYTGQVEALLRQHPGIVTITYNNNEPNEASLQRLDTWHTAVERFPGAGAAGYGLSNQSWLRNFHPMDTTPQEIIAWTQSALDKDCRLIQFEPAWFFFQLPAGTFETDDDSRHPGGERRGTARESLKQLTAFLLAATAGPQAVTEIFRQPGIDANGVDACVIGEVQPDSERFYVRLGNVGKGTPMVAQTWDVGRYTGLSFAPGESLSAFQRGPLPSGEGTAVQVRGREIGIWIDSDHPRPPLGSLLPVCPGYWWWDMNRAPVPFRKSGRELSLSFDLKVPTAAREGEADVYLTANFLFRDTRSQQQFWVAAILFDPRGEERFPDTVHVDNWAGGTQLPILFTALNLKSRWLHPGPGSVLFTDKPFDDYRRIVVRVTADELRTAIAAMRKAMPKLVAASGDPRDYQLVHFNINPEVFAPTGSRGQLGLSLRDLCVELLPP